MGSSHTDPVLCASLAMFPLIGISAHQPSRETIFLLTENKYDNNHVDKNRMYLRNSKQEPQRKMTIGNVKKR